MFDWQTITVALIVLCAAAYVVRRGWSRLRSFRATDNGNNENSCATGCGGCGSDKPPVEPGAPAKILVQISRPGSAARHQSH